MAEGITTLSDSTFDETINAADQPVIVDFWAEWCGPCKMIAPILGEIASEQSDSLTVAKRLVGAKGKGALLQELQEFLPTSR